ncbi:MAG TPA: DUF3574 domain-containing protein [Steroidobacteraceae bacterium]|nr:DUF3574 domain-containing protein [Steroidobacteraceae bacterium]
MRSALFTLLAAWGFAGCASVDRAACAAGEQSAVSETIYFGMAKPTGGNVSQEEWANYLRTEVTPRFPAGLTVWPAAGQWRGNDGQVVREDSYVLNLLHPADASAEREVQAIVAEYKKQFAQEAVLRVRSRVCTSL